MKVMRPIYGNCSVNKATVAFTEVDWRKFHKLDLVLLIPALILGSFFIAAISNLFSTTAINDSTNNIDNFPFLVDVCTFHLSVPGLTCIAGDSIPMTIVVVILRSISSFFIIRLILKSSQGINVNNFGVPPIFQSYALLLYCFVIVGIIPVVAVLPILIIQFLHNNLNLGYTTIAFYVLDVGFMFLSTWVVWRHYMKHVAGKREESNG